MDIDGEAASQYDSDSEFEYEKELLDGHKYVSYQEDFMNAMRELEAIMGDWSRAMEPCPLRESLEYAQRLVSPDLDLERSLVHNGFICVDPHCQESWVNIGHYVRRCREQGGDLWVRLGLHVVLSAIHGSIDFDHEFFREASQRVAPILELLRAEFATAPRRLLFPVELPDDCHEDGHHPLRWYGHLHQ